jgi:hypothetical protein
MPTIQPGFTLVLVGRDTTRPFKAGITARIA